MRPRLGKGAAALSVAALLGFGAYVAAPASAADVVHYVDPVAASPGPGTGCGAAAGYATLAAAMTAATTGDIIEVCPGIHAGPLTINKANLTIRGAKAGIPAGPAANPVDRGTGESIIEVSGATGNVVTWSGGVGINTTIDGLTLRTSVSGTTGSTGTAISLGTSGHTIRNNMVEWTGTQKPLLQSGVLGGRTNGVRFESNNFKGFNAGLYLSSGNIADAQTIVEDNYIEFTNNGVLHGSNSANNHIVRDNRLVGIGASGVGVNSPMRAGLVIENNTITGGAYGVYLTSAASSLGLYSSGSLVTGNTITGAGYGVVQQGRNALLPEGSPSNTVTNNNIVGSTAYAILNSAAPGALDLEATCNWYGDVAGPTTDPTPASRRISAGVNATPWSVAANPGGACTGGLSSAPVVRVADAEVLEVASGQIAAYVPVMLDEPASENVTVRFYTTSGSATGGNAPGVGVDFRNWGTVASPRQVVIPAGSTQAVIAPPIYADGVAESNETFTVTLASVSGGGVELSDDVDASVTIVDADNLGTTDPVLYVGNGTVFEADDGTRQLQFHVQLNRPAGASTNVSLVTANGSAVAGADFVQRGFTVKFGATEVSKIFNVTLVNDTVGESAETFSLNGAVVSGPLVEELQSSATGTILDND